MKKGTEYEMFIEELYKTLAPDAVVRQNDFIHGRDSNSDRQIDVSIRYKFVDTDQLILIEAKDWKIPVDIKIVDGFKSKIRDVGANKGIIISRTGFSKKAIEYARNSGIDTLSVHSAKHKKWETLLQIPVIRNEYHFEIDTDLMYEIRQFAGQQVVWNEWRFTYNDGETSFDLMEIIDTHKPLRASNKELFSRKTIIIDFKKPGLKGLFNNTWVPMETATISFRFKSHRKYYQYFSPPDYVVVKNHEKDQSDIKSTFANVEPFIDEKEWTSFKNNSDLPVFGNIEIFNYDYFLFNDSMYTVRFILEKQKVKYQ